MSAKRTAAGASRGNRGRFIVLDGVDGCGKSTQARALADALARPDGTTALHLREPGSTSLGELLRAVLLSRHTGSVSPRAETLLFAASRAQMLTEIVEPALAAGRDVVCERFHPSTFAYQAVAGGIPERDVLDLLEQWAGTPRPDVVIVLSVPLETAAKRRGKPSDRIEDKGIEYHREVARGYARYAELVPSTVVIDGTRDKDTVTRDVLAEVKRATR